jgi:FtsP/CotA-like multicopper oxidase with cupredoxin domain
MDFDPMDRRNFLGIAGGALVCTIAGRQYDLSNPRQLKKANAALPVPPKVAAAKNNPGVTKAAVTGNRKEYWITAEPRNWNAVPKKKDQMMNRRLPRKNTGGTTGQVFGYRLYSPNFAQPLGPATIPGPLLDATVGDTLVVHFQNRCPLPVTMHPHGIFYSNEMDGAYKGVHTDPGGFVQTGRTFTYVWECPEGTQGSWLYHDHGPWDPGPLYKGLFGPLVIRDPDEPLPDREYFLAFHTFLPGADFPKLKQALYAINGRAYTGNTPTMTARVGDDVAMHVYGIDNDFHTFHVHGHRWEENGTVIDNKTFGPGDSFRVRWIEDNPGRWLYHCHVFSHLHQGMSGWYNVE